MGLQFLRRLYRLSLNLFPKEYREEYGEELQAVFGLSIDAAATKGGIEVERLVLRELIGLPQAILYEYLRERRNVHMLKNFNSRCDFAPGSRKEVLAAVAPFLLFGAIPVLVGLLQRVSTRPYLLEEVLAFPIIASVISLLVVGFFRSVPRWFMPYLGLPLPVISMFSSGLVNKWADFPIPYLSSLSPLRQFFHDGFGHGWILLIPLIILLVVFSVIIPRLWPFYRCLRNDWTLLCFILYGASPVMALSAFEGYINYGFFVIVMFFILAVGGWLYLRSDVPWKKFLVLLGGMTLSMFIAAGGQAILYQSSLYNDPRPYTVFPWWNTASQTVIAWMWLALIMLLSLAINLLPQSGNSPKTT